MKIEKITLAELFFLKFKIPTDMLSKIREEVDSMIGDNFQHCESFNHHLAGVIEKQFYLPYSKNYIDNFFSNSEAGLPFKAKIYAEDIWVNFQSKHEYNPLHDHGKDSDLSFVLWLSIPYDINHEVEYYKKYINGKDFSNAQFEFVFPSFIGDRLLSTHIINVDKSYEGTMIIFPSWLPHSVSPFYTSNDYRISVAGNLTLLKNLI